jgi:hypothetical protein
VKLLPIPSIPGVSVLRTVNSVVWSKDPYELQDYNRARMEAMGTTTELIDAFFEVPWMSPTGQTFFITALETLSEAENRPRAIELVLRIKSVDEARFLVEAAQMLAWLNERESSVKRLVPGERMLVALTGDGREMIALPVDRLSWTREVAELVSRRTPGLAAEDVDSLELWLARDVSPLAERELEEMGWRVESELVERMRKDPLIPAEGQSAPAG